MRTLCQTCGDNGFPNALVTCVRCRDSVEHRYCTSEWIENFENDVDWICYDCRLWDEDQSIPIDPISIPSNGNALMPLTSVQRSDFCMEIQSPKNTCGVAPMAVQMGEISLFQEACEVPFEADSTKFVQVTAKRPRFLKNKHTSCSSMDLDESQKSAQKQGPSNISELYDNLSAQPFSEPSWKGSFNIWNNNSCIVMEFAAHISTKASCSVFEALQIFPALLPLRLYPRLQLWPKSFCRSMPTDGQIGLYFLPEKQSDKRVYNSLLDDIVHRDLALVAVIDNLELLVFSSLQLPEKCWRFLGNNYLWGVIKENKCDLHGQFQLIKCNNSMHATASCRGIRRKSIRIGGSTSNQFHTNDSTIL